LTRVNGRRTGYANLPLHGGRTPPWLFQRMVRLGRAIVEHTVSEHSAEELLRRLSDPYWFQALGCVLGFDWHSSGVTTTTCGALKEAVRGSEESFGLWVAGGKGRTSRLTPSEIAAACERTGGDGDALARASRLAAKVDNTALQSGHQLYHHSFFLTASGSWAVVQQGMRDTDRTARRFHWLGEQVDSFVSEPHAAVCAPRSEEVLNLVAAESEPARTAITELAGTTKPGDAKHLLELDLPRRHALLASADVNPRFLEKVLLSTYENPPEDFEALLGVPGLGPKTLRALALVVELVYGTPASTRDPARFAFAHGGKDGTPYRVDRETYDRTIETMNRALSSAGVDRSERVAALKRLARYSGRRPTSASQIDFSPPPA
jgi:uncharacterized protein